MSTVYYGQHNGIVLASGFLQKNPVTIAANGTITSNTGYNGDAVYAAGYPWTIDNLGTVVATTTAGTGVDLRAGGEVVNGSPGNAGALIQGGPANLSGGDGIDIAGGPGTVVNFGTIAVGPPGAVSAAIRIGGAGVQLAGGGAVVNGRTGSGAALIAGGVTAAGAAVVTNYGTIGAGPGGNGLVLAAGGSMTNFGTVAPVYGAAYVTNQAGAAIQGGVTLRGTAQALANAGLITGPVSAGATAATIANFGTIAGNIADTVPVKGLAGTAINSGVIVGAVGAGVVVNSGVISGGTTGGITGGTFGAVQTAVNSGLVTGPVFAHSFSNSGTVVGNAQITDTMTNSGLITGPGTPYVVSGPVTNTGTVAATAAGGVAIQAGATVVNLGLVAATAANGTGIRVNPNSAYIANGASGTSTALIQGGGFGIAAVGAPATVVNFATIAATGSAGFGISLQAGGTVTNKAGGSIVGGIGAAGVTTVFNYGNIAHTTGAGLLLGAGGTVVDGGTVAGGGGGAGIFFGGTGANLLVLEGGYAIAGGIYGSAGASNTVELLGSAAAPVRVDFNKAGLVNFRTAAFAPGAGNYATLVISNSAALPGLITGFVGAHDAIDLPGLSDAGNDATVSFNPATDVLTVTGDNGSVALQLDNENYPGFGVRNDGSGGTLVTVAAPPPADTTAPVVAADNPLTVVVGAAAVISASLLRATDPDNSDAQLTYTVVAPPAHGTLLDNGAPSGTFTQADIDNGLVQYHENGDAVGSDSFTFRVSDPAGNSTGVTTFAIQIQGTAPPPAPNVFTGTYTSTIVLSNPATQNPATVAASGVVAVANGDGVYGAPVYAWNVTNLGSVMGSPNGIQLAAGGAVTNLGAVGGSYFGAYIGGGYGVLTNAGNISGGGAGVVTTAGGLVTNYGAIAGGAVGLYLIGSAGVTNTGLVSGSTGVDLASPGGVVTNLGTFAGSGGYAAVFAGYGAALVAYPGAVFQGTVLAGGTGNTLFLAAGNGSGGPIALGIGVVGFGTVQVEPGARWLVSGFGSNFSNNGTVVVDGALVFQGLSGTGVVALGNSGLAEFAGRAGPGQTLLFTDNTGTLQLDRPRLFRALVSGFGAGDTIDLAGKQANGVSFANHHLTVTENGNLVASLRLAGPSNSSEFALSPDGNGGTDITFTGPPAEFWTLKT